MAGNRYRVEADEECYPGTDVLINLADLRDPAALEEFEVLSVGRAGRRLPRTGSFDTVQYRDLHRHLFGDVYGWAGSYRTRVMWKNASRFAQPDFIPGEMEKLFARLQVPPFLPDSATADVFVVQAAELLGDLNHIHPFREGNGRTQLTFLRQLGLRAGHPFRSEAVEPESFLRAMIDSYHGRMDALVDELERMLA